MEEEYGFDWFFVLLVSGIFFVFWMFVHYVLSEPKVIEKEVEVIRYKTEYQNIPISDSMKFKKCESNYWTYTYTATFWNSLVWFDLEEKCEF